MNIIGIWECTSGIMGLKKNKVYSGKNISWSKLEINGILYPIEYFRKIL